MTKEDNIIVPRWFLEVVENTLQIQNNINLDEKNGETCQDRNIRQSLNGVRKLLNGEELTGMERLEKLQPSLPSNLDEAAKESAEKWRKNLDGSESRELFFQPHIRGFKAGAEWMAGQYEKIEGELVDWYSNSNDKDYCCGVKSHDAFEVPEGFYIRKKQ